MKKKKLPLDHQKKVLDNIAKLGAWVTDEYMEIPSNAADTQFIQYPDSTGLARRTLQSFQKDEINPFGLVRWQELVPALADSHRQEWVKRTIIQLHAQAPKGAEVHIWRAGAMSPPGFYFCYLLKDGTWKQRESSM